MQIMGISRPAARKVEREAKNNNTEFFNYTTVVATKDRIIEIKKSEKNLEINRIKTKLETKLNKAKQDNKEKVETLTEELNQKETELTDAQNKADKVGPLQTQVANLTSILATAKENLLKATEKQTKICTEKVRIGRKVL